jgi:D-glycero-D-manno-heptose 1,7-bisphosphate phosphatase
MKVAFLDRDGVINKEVNYLHKIEDFKYTENCIAGLKKLRELDYEIIIITNQAGIARGFYNVADYQKLTDWYLEDLSSKGIKILDVFYCPHHPKGTIAEYAKVCDCRKPKPGMFIDASNKYKIDFASSIMIGDKISDVEAAISFGLSADNCCLVTTGHTIFTNSDTGNVFNDTLQVALR